MVGQRFPATGVRASPAGGERSVHGSRQNFERSLCARQAALVGVHALCPAPESSPHILCRRTLRQPQDLGKGKTTFAEDGGSSGPTRFSCCLSQASAGAESHSNLLFSARRVKAVVQKQLCNDTR